ncbi:MAG: helix-turn-helix transcriptional regulator [Ilumatobacteraceae bacterium]
MSRNKIAVTGSDWLKFKMEQCGFKSLQQAADACGLDKGTLYRYFAIETRPSIDVIPKLCKGLKASPLEVLQALGIQ